MSERDDWAEINRLEAELAQARADLAAALDRAQKLDFERTAAELERDTANARASKHYALAVELSDKVNGTPCAEIRWQQERDELRAELAAAREALKPFAEAADNFDTMPIKDPEGWFAYSGCISATSIKGSISVGDLRRARAMLKGDGNE